MKMIKKILSMILVISMLVGLSVSAFAWDHKPPMPPKPEQPKTYSVKEIDVEVDGNYKAGSVTVVIGDKSVSNTSYQQVKAEYEDNEWELKFKNNKSWKLSQYPTKDNVVVYLNGTPVSVQEVELDEGELDIKVSAPVKTYTVTVNYVDVDSKTVLDSETYSMQKNQEQEIEFKTIPDYQLMEDSGKFKRVQVVTGGPQTLKKNNTVIKCHESDATVNVYYKAAPKTYTVTVKYEGAPETLEAETVTVKETEAFELDIKEFDGYTYEVTSDSNATQRKDGKYDITGNCEFTVKYTAVKTTNTTAEIKVFITGEHEKKSVSVTYGEYAADSGWVYESGKAAEGEADHWELDLHGDDKWELPTELNANDFAVTIDGNEATVTSVENIYDTTWCDQEYELYIYVTMPEAKPETYNVTVTYVCDDESVELPADISESVEAGNFEFALPTIEGYDATVSVEDYTVTEDVATITVNSDINVVVTYVKQTEVPGGGEPEEEEPETTTAYPVYVHLKAPADSSKLEGVFSGDPNQYGYYLIGRMDVAGIREPMVQNPRMTGNTADYAAAAAGLSNIELFKIGGDGYLDTDANEAKLQALLANAIAETPAAEGLKVVLKKDIPTGYEPDGYDSKTGMPAWHYNLVLQETTSGEPEIKPDPEPVDPPKSTIDIHVHIENNYKPGKLTLDYGAGTIVESQFSNNYDEVLKCWVKPDVDPDSLPALETDNFEVTLNGYTAFVSDVVKDEDGNAVCIHVDVPDVVYVYVCVVDENGNIIEEDAPNAEAAKDVVRPYFKNVNSTKKYYTLGSISVDGLPAPVYNDHNKGKLSDEELDAQFEAYADLLIPGLEEKIDLYKVNWAEGADDAKIKEMMQDVTWNVLHVDNGANDYNLGTVDGKIKPAVWHLDGYLTLKAEEPTDPPTEEPETPPTNEPETPPTNEPETPPTNEPETPPTNEPETPPTNEGGEGEQQPGNDDNDDDITPTTPVESDPGIGGGDDVTIEDEEDVPLGGEPEGDETIEDEDVPLGDMPEEELEEIEDDEVPLDATPKTGNALRMIRNIAFAIAALSFSGLMASVVITKKKFDF